MLIGGVLRLLAMRLLRGARRGLGELPVEVPRVGRKAMRSGGGSGALVEPVRSGGGRGGRGAIGARRERVGLPRGRHRMSRVEVATNQRERILAATALAGSTRHGYLGQPTVE